MEDEETDRSPAGRVSVEERGIQEERGLAPTVPTWLNKKMGRT